MSTVKMLLLRWSESAKLSDDAVNVMNTALDSLPFRARTIRDLNPVADFTSSLCEPCDRRGVPSGAVWRDGCTWECPRDFYLHTELDVERVNTSTLQAAQLQEGSSLFPPSTSHRGSSSAVVTEAAARVAGSVAGSVGGVRALAAAAAVIHNSDTLAPVVQSCQPCTVTCPSGYEAVGECPAGSNRNGRTCSPCRFGPHGSSVTMPTGSFKDPLDPCGYSCREGFFRHPNTRACVPCVNKCKPGFTPTGECPAGSTEDKRCEACGETPEKLPDGALFVHHCEWECGEGYYRPRDRQVRGSQLPSTTTNAAATNRCVRCTTGSDCPAGTQPIGACPAGSRFDAVKCIVCDSPLPRNARWLAPTWREVQRGASSWEMSRESSSVQEIRGGGGRGAGSKFPAESWCEWTCKDGGFKCSHASVLATVDRNCIRFTCDNCILDHFMR